MEKVLYVLWRPVGVDPDDLRDALVGPTAEALVAAGARGVQVNVSDTAVAPAIMRIASGEPQPDAVVGVWLDSAVDARRRPFDEVVAASAARWAAYAVTESEPLPNRAHPPSPGSRTTGYAQMAFLRRPDRLSRAEWLDRWLNGQTQVAIDTQATFRYVQNLVVRPLVDGPAYDAVVEECFPAEALGDIHAFFGTGGDDAELQRRLEVMGASTSTFIDDDRLDVVPTSEYVVTTPW